MSKRLTFLPLLLSLLALVGCSSMDIVIPGASRALFHDEFVPGHTGNWLLESDDAGATSIIPEQMLIEINTPNLVQYTALKEPSFTDFTLQVTGRLISGSPVSSYGIHFRKQGPGQFYRFAITGDGMYILERHDPDGARLVLSGDWRESPAINQGLETNNLLQVTAVGPSISVFANDVLLGQFTDEAYAEGTVALEAGTFNDAASQVAFDNLIVIPPER